jgi:hypothetical protein
MNLAPYPPIILTGTLDHYLAPSKFLVAADTKLRLSTALLTSEAALLKSKAKNSDGSLESEYIRYVAASE